MYAQRIQEPDASGGGQNRLMLFRPPGNENLMSGIIQENRVKQINMESVQPDFFVILSKICSL